MSSVQIIELSEQHLAYICELIATLPDVTLRDEETIPNLQRALNMNPGLSSVAILNDSIVGAVFLGEDGYRAMLHHLFVTQENRRKGIARDLIDRSLRELKERTPVRRCFARVYHSNSDGNNCMAKCGFRKSSGDGGVINAYTIDLS